MRYKTLDSSLYIKNRKNFMKQMPARSLAVFNSNDVMPMNADGTMTFWQNSDLFYLTGIDQEESILVLFPDFDNDSWREILFVTETNEHIAVWEGHKYTKEEATAASGIPTVMWLSQFETVFNTLMAEAEQVFINTNEHIRNATPVETRDMRFIKWLQERYPAHQYRKAAPILYDLRAIKDPQEISQMERACKITEDAFRRTLKFVKPGVKEYEVEAEVLHEFVRQGSKGFAYTPIVASGANACVLHYIENKDVCKDGELLLMDVGAEYGNYNADMTRAIPVNGRYTQRQKDVYNAVLRVMKECYKILTPGNRIPEYHKEVGKLMESELLGLGLLDKTDIKNQDPANPAYKKYFMHGTSHHIGLDVHDVGNIYRKFEPNMVFTIEPGIYIQNEGLGIRLENDVVITKDGHHDMMGNIPIEIDEIEDIMNS